MWGRPGPCPTRARRLPWTVSPRGPGVTAFWKKTLPVGERGLAVRRKECGSAGSGTRAAEPACFGAVAVQPRGLRLGWLLPYGAHPFPLRPTAPSQGARRRTGLQPARAGVSSSCKDWGSSRLLVLLFSERSGGRTPPPAPREEGRASVSLCESECFLRAFVPRARLRGRVLPDPAGEGVRGHGALLEGGPATSGEGGRLGLPRLCR